MASTRNNENLTKQTLMHEISNCAFKWEKVKPYLLHNGSIEASAFVDEISSTLDALNEGNEACLYIKGLDRYIEALNVFFDNLLILVKKSNNGLLYYDLKHIRSLFFDIKKVPTINLAKTEQNNNNIKFNHSV